MSYSGVYSVDVCARSSSSSSADGDQEGNWHDVVLRRRGRAVFATTHRRVLCALLCRFAPYGGAAHTTTTTKRRRHWQQQHHTSSPAVAPCHTCSSDNSSSDSEGAKACDASTTVTSDYDASVRATRHNSNSNNDNNDNDDDDDDEVCRTYLCVFHGEELHDRHGRYALGHAHTVCTAYSVHDTAASTTTLALHGVQCVEVCAGLRGVFVHGARHTPRFSNNNNSAASATTAALLSSPATLDCDGALYVAARDVLWMASPLVLRPVYVRTVGTTAPSSRSRDGYGSPLPPPSSSSSSRVCVTLAARVIGQLRLPHEHRDMDDKDSSDDSDDDDDAMLTLVQSTVAVDELGLATTRVQAAHDALMWTWWPQRVRLPQPLSASPLSALSLTAAPHAALRTQALFVRDACAGVVYVLQTPQLRSGRGALRLLFCIATDGPVTVLRCLRASTPQPVAVLRTPHDDAVTVYNPLQLASMYSDTSGSDGADDADDDNSAASASAAAVVVTLPLHALVHSPLTLRDDNNACTCTCAVTACSDGADDGNNSSSDSSHYSSHDSEDCCCCNSEPSRLLVDNIVYAEGAVLWVRRRGSVAQCTPHKQKNNATTAAAAASLTSSSLYGACASEHAHAATAAADNNNKSNSRRGGAATRCSRASRAHRRRCCEVHDECALCFPSVADATSSSSLLSLLLDALHATLGATRVYAIEYALLRRVCAETITTTTSTTSTAATAARASLPLRGAAVDVGAQLCALLVDIVRGSLPWTRDRGSCDACKAMRLNTATTTTTTTTTTTAAAPLSTPSSCMYSAQYALCLDAAAVDALYHQQQSSSSATATSPRVAHSSSDDSTTAHCEVVLSPSECGVCALTCHMLCESCRLLQCLWPLRDALASLTRQLCTLLGWRAYTHVYSTLAAATGADEDKADDGNDDGNGDDDVCGDDVRAVHAQTCEVHTCWSFARVLPRQILRSVFALDDDDDDDDDSNTATSASLSALLRGQPPMLYDCLTARLLRAFASPHTSNNSRRDSHSSSCRCCCCCVWPVLTRQLPLTHPLALACHLYTLFRHAFDVTTARRCRRRRQQRQQQRQQHGSVGKQENDDDDDTDGDGDTTVWLRDWWRRVCVDVAQCGDALTSLLSCADDGDVDASGSARATAAASRSLCPAVRYVLLRALCIGREHAHGQWASAAVRAAVGRHDLVRTTSTSTATSSVATSAAAVLRVAAQRAVGRRYGATLCDDGVRIRHDIPRMWRDARLDEAQALLNTTAPIALPSNIATGELRHTLLVACATRATALPVGRGMLTMCTERLRTRDSVPVPALTLDGRTADDLVVVNHSAEAQPERLTWPYVHNGCAAALRFLPLPPQRRRHGDGNNGNKNKSSNTACAAAAVSMSSDVESDGGALGRDGDDHNNNSSSNNDDDGDGNGAESDEAAAVTRHWIVYQTRHVRCVAARAGLLLAAGLLGHLRVLQLTDIYSLLVAPPPPPPPSSSSSSPSSSPPVPPLLLQARREAMTAAVLLGLSCSFRGTRNELIFRCVSMHIRALTPSAEDMEVSLDVQSAALVSLGLLCQRRPAEEEQHEQQRRPPPRRGTATPPTTATAAPPAHPLLVELMASEMSRLPSDEHCMRREGYALAAGCSLGLLLLGAGASHGGDGGGSNGNSSSSWRLEERLLQMMHGARRAPPAASAAAASSSHGNDDDAFAERHTLAVHMGNNGYSSYSNNSSNNNTATAATAADAAANTIAAPARGGYFLTRALVTHTTRRVLQHTCTLVDEGDCYNAAVSGPAAVMALGLMYMKTNDARMARALRVRDGDVDALQALSPLLTLLRTCMAALVCWRDVAPHRAWVRAQLPRCLQHYARCHGTKNNNKKDDGDGEGEGDDVCARGLCTAQVQYLHMLLGHSIAGAVLALSLRHAGSADRTARRTVTAHLRGFLDGRVGATALRASKVALSTGAYAMCIATCALALGVVCAGSGDKRALSLLRALYTRTAGVDYGAHMAVGMACGLLFLGAGRLTLSTSTSSVAALLVSLYPCWPRHAEDNAQHLQLLRHLYVVAVVPRVLTAMDAQTLRSVSVPVRVVLRGSAHAPHASEDESDSDDNNKRHDKNEDDDGGCGGATAARRDVWLRTPCLYPPPEMVLRVEVHSTHHYRTTLVNKSDGDDSGNNSGDTAVVIRDDGLVLRVQRRARGDCSDSDEANDEDDHDNNNNDDVDEAVAVDGVGQCAADVVCTSSSPSWLQPQRRRQHTASEQRLLDWLARLRCRAHGACGRADTPLATCAMLDALHLLRTAQRTLTALDDGNYSHDGGTDDTTSSAAAVTCWRARELVSADVVAHIHSALEQHYGALFVRTGSAASGDAHATTPAAVDVHPLHDLLVTRRPWCAVVRRAAAHACSAAVRAAFACTSGCRNDHIAHAVQQQRRLCCCRHATLAAVAQWLAEAVHYYHLDGNHTAALTRVLRAYMAAATSASSSSLTCCHDDTVMYSSSSAVAATALLLRYSTQLAQPSCEVLARLLPCCSCCDGH